MTISTFMGLETGKRAIMTSRNTLDVTAHNIANANTDGYTRQRAELVATSAFAAPGMPGIASAGQIGTGVETHQIKRIKMDFFDKRVQNETQRHAKHSNVYQNLSQVELLLNEPSENGLRSTMDKFWQSTMDLSNDPESPAARQVVVETGIALSNSFSQMYEEMTTLRNNLDEEIIARVGETNRLVEEIGGLNEKIAGVKNIGKNPNDLLDRRDLLLDNLAELVNIDTTYKGVDDELVVSVNGKPIIQGSHYSKLEAVENRDNEDLVDVRWEKDFVPLSSDSDIVTVFANSSVRNQSHTIDVKDMARSHILKGPNRLAYSERSLNNIENNPEITTGYFEVNDKKIWIDADEDNLLDVVSYINESQAGVVAEIDDNRLVFNAADSGEDNTVVLKSGTSNFLREMGMTNSFESQNSYFEKNVGLGLNGSFSLDGAEITVATTDTLEDIVENINKEDTDARAYIEETNQGTYKMVLESDNGNYNFTIDDTDDLLTGTTDNEFGFDFGDEFAGFESGQGIINGYLMSDNEVQDQFEKGLARNQDSEFELEVNSGSVTINIDQDRDSLALIAEDINGQIASAGPPVEDEISAEIVQDAENNFRLLFKAADGEEIGINNISGNILENLGLREGTYNQKGPVSYDAQTALYNFNGIDRNSQSNRVEDIVPGVNVVLRGEGQANVEVRQTLNGGKLKGLLESRDEVVSKYMRDIDELAYSLMKEVNDVHYTGFGTDGKSQRSFFEIYNGAVDGYPEIASARSMRVNDEIQNNVNALAAAGRDTENTNHKGLPVSEGIGSGENALRISDLKFKQTMLNETATFNEYFNHVIADIGTKAHESSRVVDNQEVLLSRLEDMRQQVSGVSLDEEMSNMVRFQHAYNAGARVISTMDKMLETVISLGR
ncbi:MAG: flagellar hook-associated protein FlgK [Candidatus Muiribacteriota bacterium]